jgi:Ran GTPase-activating protein (RanGAP) involved in mRNA processing and transport
MDAFGRDEYEINWKNTTCELDENILYNLNGIAGLRVSRDSVIFDRNLIVGRTLGVAIGISHCLIKIRSDVFPSSPCSLRELFEGLARNRSIQRLCLVHLDVTQVDVFAIMLPFFEHNHNLRCVEILWSNMSQRTASFITALSKCKRLERIVLFNNDYGINQTRGVIASLRGHPNLLELDLGGDVEMSTATRMGGCAELAVLLCHSTSNLLSLQLSSCDIDDASLAVLSKSLAKSKCIKKINVFSNGEDEITEIGWKSFSAALSSPTCPLEIISLDSTRISDEGVISVGNLLTVNVTVKHLNLTGSDLITSEGWQRFARCLSNPNIALEELDVGRCHNIDGEVEVGLDDEGAIAIGESLAMNTTLKKLDMSHNFNVTSDGWIQFFHVLLHSKCSLEELDVSSNYIGDEGVAAMVNLLVTMRDFHTLHLRESDCTANGLRTFTRLLQPSSKVTTLDLGRNDFSDEVVNDFVDMLANNSTLTTLHIGGDETTDNSWAALSHALCDETSIENTYSSNHTLHSLEKFDDDVRAEIPDNLSALLRLNKNQDKASVRRQKILIRHFHESVCGVEVKGCGIPDINGYFTQSGSCDGVLMYTKISIYQGHETVFSMFRCKIYDDTRRWYISIVPTDAAHPGTNQDYDFYAAIPDDKDGIFPPQANWMPNDMSSSPAPKVDLIHGSVDIQVFDGMSRSTLPSALEWIGRDTMGFSLMYNVVRGIPKLLESKFIAIDVGKKMKYLHLHT